jgi:hypothetical protein
VRADEALVAQLDALQVTRPGPAADGARREVDVGRGEQLGRVREGDPVGRRPGHGDRLYGFGLSDVAEAASVDGLDPDSEPTDSFALAGLEPPERSLRAQPVPLKWTAGGEKAFFIAPPHSGQALGPWPWMEWLTSIMWPQLEHT